jgi:hypothetical protein
MPGAAATVTGNFVPATTQITITTYPASLLVSVDGGSFVPAPLVETWNQNSTHTIATTSPQSGGTGIQYTFSSWSDNGAISHTITMPATATTYTASFATQYFLTVSAGAGGAITVTSAPNAFYNAGTVQTIAATPNAVLLCGLDRQPTQRHHRLDQRHRHGDHERARVYHRELRAASGVHRLDHSERRDRRRR